MLFKLPSIAIACMLILSGCTVEPEPINFGTDACNYCKMNIVDSQHAAEFVTKKGKIYKFDAIECMMNQMKDFESDEIALFMVSDYTMPGELTDAVTATYLRTESIPSPMGGFLTGFRNVEEAEKILSNAEGEQFDWNQLK
ncbi:MAG: nitrous oxide reductase accessory protein NosL, partial [Flavobacteriales bacterium]|nr:nitrous oxide reductase accessory protein NosL [Flavobacteriales bacterium]